VSIFSYSSVSFTTHEISLNADAIVCFVGENSSGKSSALKSLRYPHGTSKTLSHVVNCTTQITHEDRNSEEIKKYLRFENDDKITNLSSNGGVSGARVVSGFLEGDGPVDGSISTAFIAELNLTNRLSSIAPSPLPTTGSHRPITPMQWMVRFPEFETELSALSEDLFGFEVSICAGAVQNMTLHLGDRIDHTKFGGNRNQEYFNEIAKLPEISEQGDGVKCALGLIACCVSRSAEVYIIDEPDLYLHPPQAYEIGRTLAEILKDKQLYIATHSSRFIQGLAAAASERLIIVRLKRDGSSADAHIVDNTVFADVKADPILKFTNILEGFFHSQIVLCEDEADCLFYRATANRTLGDRAFRNTLWLGVNGKSAFKKTADIARRMKVPVTIIADFDLLRDSNDILPILHAQGVETSRFMNEISWLNQIVTNDAKVNWSFLKENGVRAFSHNAEAYTRVEKLLEDLNACGIIVNRYGEVEHLREPKLAKKGVECIGAMLAENLEGEVAYDNLRKFWDELKPQAL